MAIASQIRYVPHHDIDKAKWDVCVNNAPNGLIYAYSFYLDCMAKHWDALVMNDYEAIMPLTWNKKWGISYLYQPPFMQQLGIFSDQPLPAAIIQDFLSNVHRHFRFAEIFLNFSNKYVRFIVKNNFILPLQESYVALSGRFSPGAIKSIQRSERWPLQYSVTDNFQKVIELCHRQYGDRIQHIQEKDYANFGRLCAYAQVNNLLLARQVTDEKGLLATALMFKDKRRIYLLMSVTLQEGRSKEANYFLISNIIREYSSQDIIFDFEGSDIPGIASFYEKFGPVNQPYYFWSFNKLPWPIRLFK